MYKVLDDIADEVALEGDQGCSVDKLFTLVETLITKDIKDTHLNQPLLFDDDYKAYVWQQIKGNSHLLFSERGNPINASNLTYDGLKSMDISVSAVEEVLDRNIYGSLKHEKKSLTDKQRLLLNSIAKSRSQGISQHELGEMFDMDSKAVFYHLKRLDQLGLIVKENAYVSRMCTKLLFLKRFASIPGTKTDDDQKDDGVIYRIPVFKDNIRGLLEKAIDNIMPVADLIDALGLDISAEKKWARVRIQEMHEQGEIEKFNASDGRKTRQCVRLVTSTPTLTTQSHHLQDATQTVRHYSIARDLPSDYIFFKDIEAAGGKGLLRQDLIDKYPLIDPVQFNIFFESATLPSKNPDFDKFILHRTEEFVGRSRQFRYYTTDGWRAFSGLSTTAIPEPTAVITRPEKTEVLEEPKFIDEIARIMNQPSQKRQRYDRDKYLARKEAAKKQKINVEIADKESTLVPSKRPNSDTTDKSTGFSTLKKVKKDTLRNNTKTRRYGIIIDMVERIQIREFNQEMMNEFKRIELDTPGGQNIARRTFDDLVKELHNQRKLKIYVTAIKKANGLTEIKKFVLHPSLSGDSPQVTEFIDNYSVQKPIMNGISKRKQVKIVNMPALPQSSLTDTQTLAKPLVENTNSWRISAIENGWISSKWLRAKELHEALFKYLETKGISHGIVDMTDFLKLFSLRTLMRIYGLMPYDDPNLVEFLQANENEDMSICDLPADIKAIISQEAPRIRIRIIHLLRILHALSLVSFEEENAIDGYRIPPKIRLLTQGILRDYAAKEHPIRDTMQLNNIDDVQQYWRDLQTCCLRRRLKADTIHDENDVLYNIVLIRLWKTNTILTTTQKSILDSFVDFEAKTVPSDEDKSLRNYIAKKSDLSTKRIQAYYNSILMAFKKYEAQNEKQERRLQKTHSMAASPAITKLMQASMEKRSIDAAMFELKQHEPFIESTFVASRKLRRLRLPVEQYKSIKKTPATKPYRNPLSDVEKDVLLHAYSIMKARSENSFFFWSPISKVIPAYTPEKCRRTLHYMTVLDPTITDTIKKLKSEWLEIYHEGISKKELKDESPWDTQEYDLPAFLEYFVLKLQERESQAKQIEPLPKSLSEFHSKFIIVRDEADKNHVSHCYHEAMYDTPSDSIIDYDEKKVSVHLVMVLIKMILITPDKVYDSKDGYTLLRRFPDEIIEQAVEILTAEGLLVRGKADYGRIPGRRINVSEKFLIMASGVLPFEFFKEARHFYERMATNLSINLQSSHVNGGSVATILDLTSQRKVSMNVQNLENYTKLRRSVYYPRASAVSMRAAFIYKGLDLRITSNDSTISGYKPEKHIEHIGKSSLLNQEEIGSYLTALYAKHPFSEALYDIIASFGKTGASTSDITYVISCRYTDKAHLFSETLVVLENHKPPLVQMVGFDQLRYVASEFIASWFINQSNGQYIAPLMWYDTTGAIIPIALEGCANATMSHILQNPGITFANLRDKLRGLFTEYELYYILKYLVESERIIARKLQRQVWPKRLSIFHKRPIASISTSQTLNNDEITCYWLAPGFYV